MITAQGYPGTVRFDGQFLEIEHSGAARLTVGKGTKRLHVSQISALSIKPAGPLINGVFTVTLPGGNEIRSRAGRRTRDAGFDPNSIRFTRKHAVEFQELRVAVEQAMFTGTTHGPAAAQPADLPDQLRRLAELHDSGAISTSEFDAAKARLIA